MNLELAHLSQPYSLLLTNILVITLIFKINFPLFPPRFPPPLPSSVWASWDCGTRFWLQGVYYYYYFYCIQSLWWLIYFWELWIRATSCWYDGTFSENVMLYLLNVVSQLYLSGFFQQCSCLNFLSCTIFPLKWRPQHPTKDFQTFEVKIHWDFYLFNPSSHGPINSPSHFSEKLSKDCHLFYLNAKEQRKVLFVPFGATFV